MLAVVKTHHIDFTITGKIPAKMLNYLRKEYGKALQIKDEKSIVIKNSDWFKKLKQQVQPGDAVRVYRTNCGWTQETLGKKIGVSKYRVSDLENNRRAVSKELAKRLAKLFDAPLERFV
jgi:DNA-binding XRE family transcriptional regulator